MDDWIFVRNRHFEGLLQTATTPDWLPTARPGAWLLYLVGFGAFGEHPAMFYVAQAGVMTLTALAFRRLLRRWFEEREATFTAMVWLVLPIHSATDHWAAAFNIAVAVLLGIVGVDLLVQSVRGEALWLRCGLILVAGILTYESVVPLVAGAAAVAYWRTRERRALYVLTCVVAAGAWMIAATPKATSQILFDFTTLPEAHFGRPAFGTAVLVGVAVLIVGLLLATRTHRELAVVGLGVIVVGATAYVRFPLELIGVGDRANAATSLGTAMVLSAALLAVARERSIVAGTIAVLLLLPVRLDRDDAYADAADDVFRLVHEAPPGPVLVLGPCPRFESGVTALQGGWDASPAAQYLLSEPDLRATFGRDSPYEWTGTGCRLPERWR